MFGVDLMDAGFAASALVALVAGILSFLSPCVLPIVPPYLAYMGGIGMGELQAGHARRKAVTAALFFIMGLSTVFLLMGFAASALGRTIVAWQGWLNTLAGLTVMVFGLNFLGILKIGFLSREVRFDAGDRGGSAFGAYVLGLAFAFGWTPCIGPQLGLILSLAAQDHSIGRGAALLAVYAAGLGLPFLLVAAFLPSLSGVMRLMKSNMQVIERLMGLLLWTIGLMMLTGGFSQFSQMLLDAFPALQQLG